MTVSTRQRTATPRIDTSRGRRSRPSAGVGWATNLEALVITLRTASRRTASAALALVIAALIASPLAASADTPIAHHGLRGPHYLADSEEYPGAVCKYDTNEIIHRISVAAPFVFARDRTPMRDRQVVGWYLVVQRHSNGGGGWSTIATGPQQTAYAHDDRAAAFDRQKVSFVGTDTFTYRVRVHLLWFDPMDSKTIEGDATHEVDWYRYVVADANPGFCPGGIL